MASPGGWVGHALLRSHARRDFARPAMPAADADPPSNASSSETLGSPASDDPLSRSPQTSSVGPRHQAAPRVTLQLDTDDVQPPAVGWLEPQLERAIDLLMPGSPDGRLTLALLNDHDMASLHAQYTGVPGTTDVLTFDHREPTDTALDADIALGRDVAVREAALRGHDARTELLLYAVHGLLHLLGHDDHDPTAYHTMHAAEDQLLQQLGLSPVFASTPIPDPRPPIPASEGGAS